MCGIKNIYTINLLLDNNMWRYKCIFYTPDIQIDYHYHYYY